MAWLWLVVAAQAEPVLPWYNPDVFDQPDEFERDAICRGIEHYAKSEPLQSVTVREIDGRSRTLSLTTADLLKESRAVLEGVSIALDPQHRGSEWDFAVEEGGTRTLVTTRWMTGDHWVVELGKPFDPEAKQAPTVVELASRYGLGAFVEKEAAWDVRSRERLTRSLDLLSASERAPLKGVPMVRAKHSEGGAEMKAHAAEYVVSDLGEPSLWLLDHAFAEPGRDWAGPINAPVPDAVFSLLHEAGHAIAYAPEQRARKDVSEAVDAYNAQVTVVQESVDRYNAAAEAANNESDPEDRRDLVETANELATRASATQAMAAELASRADRLGEHLELLTKESPVIRAYVQVRGERTGPTPYGRVNDHESFADAFALHKVDPEALRRVLPEVAEWFAAGGHIRTLDGAAL